MSELTPELAPDILAACQANAEEVAGALSRALASEFTLQVGEPGTFTAENLGEPISGPGLGVLLQFGEVALVAVLPAASNMLPEWYAAPDPTGESQLSTLAQELSMLLVPATLEAGEFRAARVADCREALVSAGVEEGAPFLPLKLSATMETGEMVLFWPAANPEGFFPAESADAPAASPAPVSASSPRHMPQKPVSFTHLPPYSRSLLKIRVPVRVVLATKKESVREVVEMAPGTIIKFDKPCDEMLQLFVGNQQVAEGEAVKVGDKFGFRVSSMVMPQEHFERVRNFKAS